MGNSGLTDVSATRVPLQQRGKRVEWTTVNGARWVGSTLSGLQRIIGGPYTTVSTRLSRPRIDITGKAAARSRSRVDSEGRMAALR